MKYIKTFESISIKKYIIATMPEWQDVPYIFKTKEIDGDFFRFIMFSYFDENNVLIETYYSGSYIFKELKVLYQTDNIEDAKLKLKELHEFNVNIKKYNL